MILKFIILILLLPLSCFSDGLIIAGRVGQAECSLKPKSYLGCEKPGNTPKVFAPGFISTNDHEFSCTFSSDLSEFYFNRGQDIWVTKKSEKGWTKPLRADFNSNYLDNEPVICPDNKMMFFGSKRPHAGNNYTQDYGMWMMHREDNGWSIPEYIGDAAYISFAADGTIYTRNIKPEYTKGKIVKTAFGGDKFTDFIPQNGSVEGPSTDYLQGVHPCIAPDQSYLIFTAMYKTWGNSPELFISYKDGEDHWGQAINLSEVLGMKGIITPRISPDGKYLFFYHKHDIYWVDLKFLNN